MAAARGRGRMRGCAPSDAVGFARHVARGLAGHREGAGKGVLVVQHEVRDPLRCLRPGAARGEGLAEPLVTVAVRDGHLLVVSVGLRAPRSVSENRRYRISGISGSEKCGRGRDGGALRVAPLRGAGCGAAAFWLRMGQSARACPARGPAVAGSSRASDTIAPKKYVSSLPSRSDTLMW